MSEIDEAARIAERVLDRPYADPDDDMAILARQTKRAAELRDELKIMAQVATGFQRERDEAISSRDFSRDWYGQRFQRLRRWIDEEVRPLSEAVARRYFSICANGTADPYEPQEWRDTIHGQTIRAEQAERERDRLAAEVERLRAEIADADAIHVYQLAERDRLAAEVERLRAALENVRDNCLTICEANSIAVRALGEKT
jgi:hypothetical protein